MNLAVSSRRTKVVSIMVTAMRRATYCLVSVPCKSPAARSCAILTWIKAGHMARRGSTHHFAWVRPDIHLSPPC